MKMKKFTLIFLSILIFLLLAACQQGVEERSVVIAKINGEEVSQQELDKRYQVVKKNHELTTGETLNESKDKELAENLKERAFEEIILQKLLWQEAKASNIEVDEDKVNEDINAIKETRNKGDKNGYNDFLKELNIDEAFLINELRTEQLYYELQNNLSKEIIVDESEMQEYYQEHNNEYNQRPGIKIAHILVDNEKDANLILEKLSAGEEFGALVLEYSSCPSKTNGGDLGMVNQDSPLVVEFKNAALGMKSGELSKEPVKTEFGYHILMAGDEVAGESRSFEEIKDEIREKILREKSDEAFYQYLEKLRENAEVEDLR